MALAYVRRTAKVVQHGGKVRITRLGKAEYIKEERVHRPASVVVLYEGPFRLWEVTGRSGIAIGDSEILMQSTNMSIPWDFDLLDDKTENMPRHGDLFEVLEHSTDSYTIGSRGEIQESAKAGQLRATRRFAVTMAQSKGDHE